MKVWRISKMDDAQFRKVFFCCHDQNVVRLERDMADLCGDCGYSVADVDRLRW